MADVGTGTTITYQSGFFAEILSVDWDGPNRESVDTTHMGTTNARTHMPTDLYEPGEITVEHHLDVDALPPITDAAENVTVTLPDGAGTGSWTCSGFLTGFSFSDPLEDKMTATATLKMSGEITVA